MNLRVFLASKLRIPNRANPLNSSIDKHVNLRVFLAFKMRIPNQGSTLNGKIDINIKTITKFSYKIGCGFK